MKRLSFKLAAAILGLSFWTEAHAINPYRDAFRTSYAPQVNCGQFWMDAEYLYWGIKDSPKLIPLITSGPSATPILGSPGTTVVLGSTKIKTDWRSGGKFTAGYWLDRSHCFGFEASYLFLPCESNSASVSSSGEPGTGFLAVPYFNVLTDAEAAYRVANSNPALDGGAYSGAASYKNRNSMQGAELNLLMSMDNDGTFETGLLGGFRFWNFDERFTFTTNSPFLAFPEDVFVTRDQFNVQNNFYGGQIGLDLTWFWECLTLDFLGKIAFGATCSKVTIHGHLLTNDFNTVASTGTPIQFVGGIFALPTNSGSSNNWIFAIIPEVNVNLGYQVSESLRLNMGYTFLAVNKMARACEQIDRNLNPTQSDANQFVPVAELTGEANPVAFHKTRGFYAQGLNVGLEMSF